VIITNERIIFRHPHALGLKKDYTDYSYRDITNVTLDKGILRSSIGPKNVADKIRANKPCAAGNQYLSHRGIPIRTALPLIIIFPGNLFPTELVPAHSIAAI
jgi:hypothetical protein